jgi:hypothetical protein
MRKRPLPIVAFVMFLAGVAYGQHRQCYRITRRVPLRYILAKP